MSHEEKTVTTQNKDPQGVVPEGFKKNSVGHLVPIDVIKPEHLLEDELVLMLTDKAIALEAELTDMREYTLAEVAGLRELIAEKYGVLKGGQKGNVTLTSYDGRFQVQVSVGESISFGPELSAAKELIDSCVLRWSEGSNDYVQALIQHAFQTNQQGKIDTGRVLSLRRLAIEDPEWLNAMEAISDALRVTGSKTYTRFYRRDPIRDTLTPIALNIASAGMTA